MVGTVLLATSLSGRPHAISRRRKSGELCKLLFGLLHGTFAYAGMDLLPPMAVPSADFTDDDSYARVEHVLCDRLDHLFGTQPVRYRPQSQGDYPEEWELVPGARSEETGLSVHIVADHELSP